MTDLYTRIRAAVTNAISGAGEDPANFNVDAIVSPTPLIHGEIVRDYKYLIQQSYSGRSARQILAIQYRMKETAIKTVLRRHRNI